MSQLNRRDFVMLTAAGACACCQPCGADEAATQPSSEPSSRPASDPTDAAPVDVGAIADFSRDGVFDRVLQSNKMLIYRQGDRLYASTARCSHKRCTLMVVDGVSLKCPCHGSAFDINGVPVNGPAKVALFRIGVSIKEGRLFVHPKVQFAEADWERPEAFIDVSKAG